MTRSRFVFALAAAILSLASIPAGADEALIEGWYKALLAVDRDALSGLLAENARIKLDDLGIEQSKAEFIASMDKWQEAAAGAEIRHRTESVEGSVTTVLACYDFPENDILMRETFSIAGGQITENSQGTVADNCTGF